MLASSKLYFAQSVIDDIHNPLVSAKAGGGTPTWATVATDGAGSTGVNAWRFSATVVNQLWFSSFIPHGYKLDSNIDPHVHWMPFDGNAGDIVLELERSGANIGGVYGNTTIDTITIAAPGTTLENTLDDFAEVTGTGFQMGRTTLCRIARLGNDGDDTYGSTIYITQVDWHIIKDTDGSGTDVHTSKNIA